MVDGTQDLLDLLDIDDSLFLVRLGVSSTTSATHARMHAYADEIVDTARPAIVLPVNQSVRLQNRTLLFLKTLVWRIRPTMSL